MDKRARARASQDRAYERLRKVCMEQLGNVAKALASIYDPVLNEPIPDSIRDVWATLGTAPKRDGLQ